MLSSVPRLVTGLAIASEAIPAIPRWIIQRICFTGFRDSRSRMKTTGSITNPPRDKVSSKETMIGTSINP
ncbi:hypothetical protein D3C87_1797280 [compost metagenome]